MAASGLPSESLPERSQLTPEQQLVGYCLEMPELLPIALETVKPGDLIENIAARAFAAMADLYRRGEAITGTTVARVFENGGTEALHEARHALADWVAGMSGSGGATVADRDAVRRLARTIHGDALRRELVHIDPQIKGDLARGIEIHRELDGGPTVDCTPISGPAIQSLLEAESPESPQPETFPPDPGLIVLAAKHMSMKTRTLAWIFRRWAAGRPPWDCYVGPPSADVRSPHETPLPGTHAAFVWGAAEAGRNRIARLLRDLEAADYCDGWKERGHLFVSGPGIDDGTRAMLRLDDRGLEAWRRWLDQRQKQDPIGLLCLDSLRALKPHSLDENSTELGDWLGGLQALCVDYSMWAVLIHHEGHAARENAADAGRGSSTIGDVAQVAWNLRPDPDAPHRRILRVQGNDVPSRTLRFEVEPEDDPQGRFRYLRQVQAAVGAEEILPHFAPDRSLGSKRELFRRIHGCDPPCDTCPSTIRHRADLLIEAALRENWLRLEPAARGAQRLVLTDLAPTVPDRT